MSRTGGPSRRRKGASKRPTGVANRDTKIHAHPKYKERRWTR